MRPTSLIHPPAGGNVGRLQPLAVASTAASVWAWHWALQVLAFCYLAYTPEGRRLARERVPFGIF